MNQIAIAIAAFFALLLLAVQIDRRLFSSLYFQRPWTLLQIAGALAAVAALLAIARKTRPAAIIAAVSAVVALAESVMFEGVSAWTAHSPRTLDTLASTPIVPLAIEVVTPAAAVAVCLLILRGFRPSTCVFLVVIAANLAGLALIQPGRFRGHLEALGIVPLASKQHLSGVHTSPYPSFWLYLLIATAIAVVTLARTVNRTERQPNSA